MSRRLLRDYGSLLGLLLIGGVLSLLSDRFLTTSNLINVARQVSINAIVAAGMTIVIITGGIDLSVGKRPQDGPERPGGRLRRSGGRRQCSIQSTARSTPLVPLGFVGTLAAAGLVLFAGFALQRRERPLARYNIPAPVIGGLLVALVVTALRAAGYQPVTFDTTLQASLMIAFFTSIGFGASVPLLRAGGPAVALFLGLATAVAIAQNLLGVGVAAALGVPPLLGVLAGSVTLAGGPAIGLGSEPGVPKNPVLRKLSVSCRPSSAPNSSV